jgi:glycine/D-amino acid oxidase-like deaminating enzyme
MSARPLTDTAKLCGEPAELPRSVWLETSIAAPATRPLAADVAVDVLIVGAGFAGLSAAIHLAEKGVGVAVIDAVEPGWGASGRNNGQVIPGLKLDPDQLEHALGTATGRRLADWGGAGPDLVFDLIARYRIPCHPVRAGWIQPAYTRAAMTTIEARCAQWAARGAPVEMLAPAALPGMLGTDAFLGGWIDYRGGSINPLGYARGLAAAAMQLGASLYTHTCAISLEREADSWKVRTAAGSIRARQVLVATAAYADDLVPGLRRSFVPVRTAQVASARLPPSMANAILPGGHCASDTRRLLTSFRLAPDKRLVMGGSGATGGRDHAALLLRLHRAAAELFAPLGRIEWEYGWSGYFPVTTDHLPHWHESGDGLYCALGCNGRGIALSTALGKLAAERILGKAAGDLELAPARMAAVRFHEFRHIGIAVATAVKGLQDRFDRARSAKSARIVNRITSTP